MSKIKKICKSSEKDFKKIKEELFQEVKEPRYICKKCLRVAKTEALLCKAEKIV
ncbi:MAG: hypothetical protein JXQ65_07565 [Candidatus Marinimicrobia bacterium]|nr:hypothetical protein [Candidatus Neomarinimicrobiota bacterium]